uniref:Uncharacterized protein n=1 Tax=Bombyx mori TaxID=7091 RepID=A0A8R2LYF3_BOMMO|nr:uncharacterized protein LOC119629012 [Bombyx mori]
MALPMTKAGSRRPPSSSSVVRPSSEATDIDADDGAGDGAPFPRAGLPLGGGISSAAEAESETTTTFSGGASVSEDDVSPPFPSREETPLDFLFRLTFPFGPAASQSLTSAERVEPALAHLGSTGFPLPVAQPPSSWHALPPQNTWGSMLPPKWKHGGILHLEWYPPGVMFFVSLPSFISFLCYLTRGRSPGTALTTGHPPATHPITGHVTGLGLGHFL